MFDQIEGFRTFPAGYIHSFHEESESEVQNTQLLQENLNSISNVNKKTEEPRTRKPRCGEWRRTITEETQGHLWKLHLEMQLFDLILGPSWGRLGAISGTSWNHLGVILEPSGYPPPPASSPDTLRLRYVAIIYHTFWSSYVSKGFTDLLCLFILLRILKCCIIIHAYPYSLLGGQPNFES